MNIIEIKPDAFASRIFECNAFAVVVKNYDVDFSQELTECLEKYLNMSSTLLMYAKVPSGLVGAVTVLGSHGFCVVDTNVVLEKQVNEHKALSGKSTIRIADPVDCVAVCGIAGSNFEYTRFHLDPAVDNALADKFKAEWAGNFFSGARGDQMIVAEVDGEIAGFLQLLLRDGIMTIDLMAVSSNYRRRKIAVDMLAFAEAANDGIQIFRVGTQVANAPALACYEGFGFRVVSSSYVLHFHG